ncbi:hypothetical protein EV424DRAFT_1356468 [Suillus variegatus]|nr:hypothetical protein EV424DRAFT_1356468 [Suillus variegatus]
MLEVLMPLLPDEGGDNWQEVITRMHKWRRPQSDSAWEHPRPLNRKQTCSPADVIQTFEESRETKEVRVVPQARERHSVLPQKMHLCEEGWACEARKGVGAETLGVEARREVFRKEEEVALLRAIAGKDEKLGWRAGVLCSWTIARQTSSCHSEGVKGAETVRIPSLTKSDWSESDCEREEEPSCSKGRKGAVATTLDSGKVLPRSCMGAEGKDLWAAEECPPRREDKPPKLMPGSSEREGGKGKFPAGSAKKQEEVSPGDVETQRGWGRPQKGGNGRALHRRWGETHKGRGRALPSLLYLRQQWLALKALLAGQCEARESAGEEARECARVLREARESVHMFAETVSLVDSGWMLLNGWRYRALKRGKAAPRIRIAMDGIQSDAASHAVYSLVKSAISRNVRHESLQRIQRCKGKGKHLPGKTVGRGGKPRAAEGMHPGTDRRVQQIKASSKPREGGPNLICIRDRRGKGGHAARRRGGRRTQRASRALSDPATRKLNGREQGMPLIICIIRRVDDIAQAGEARRGVFSHARQVGQEQESAHEDCGGCLRPSEGGATTQGCGDRTKDDRRTTREQQKGDCYSERSADNYEDITLVVLNQEHEDLRHDGSARNPTSHALVPLAGMHPHYAFLEDVTGIYDATVLATICGKCTDGASSMINVQQRPGSPADSETER